MTQTERDFPAGTIIRCNRCHATKGPAPRGFHAVRENDKVWRMNQDMMVHPECGHMDSHWVFDNDQANPPKRSKRPQREARSKGAGLNFEKENLSK